MSFDLSASVAQDVAFVASDAPCSPTDQLEGGWSCFRGRGDQYHGTPAPGTRLPSGPASGPTRLLIGVEVPFEAWTLGARVGWAFRGLGPASDGQHDARTASIEALGRVHLTTSGSFRLDLLGVVGWRRLDAHASVTVTEDRSVPPSLYQRDNPDRQTLDAYKRLGMGAIGVGLAATYVAATWSALRLEVPVSAFFPTSGVAVTPTASWVVTL